MNSNVFYASVFFIFFITICGAIWPTELSLFFKNLQAWLVTKTSWIYVLGVGTTLFMSLYLMVSRLGDIKLGPDHSEAAYGNLSWFAMLFSAGMGIGLLFFGVAEPMMHFSAPPVGDPNTVESAREAMVLALPMRSSKSRFLFSDTATGNSARWTDSKASICVASQRSRYNWSA